MATGAGGPGVAATTQGTGELPSVLGTCTGAVVLSLFEPD